MTAFAVTVSYRALSLVPHDARRCESHSTKRRCSLWVEHTGFHYSRSKGTDEAIAWTRDDNPDQEIIPW